jgi:hypothetical protein
LHHNVRILAGAYARKSVGFGCYRGFIEGKPARGCFVKVDVAFARSGRYGNNSDKYYGKNYRYYRYGSFIVSGFKVYI